MSQGLHVALTVVEILALVIAVAVYLIIFARQLGSISESAWQASVRLRATEEQLRELGTAAAEINSTLDELHVALSPVAEKAASQAVRR
ncbi:MAG: hypothetical protein H0T96_01390 [Thermoleophilaceae bacterium]|jgi:nitrogen fixation protein FixH|nr:hypothetical protein [Thermoleophilaceae bacterium]